MRARPAVRPIFIIGAPRSGTSVLTWALGQHPNIQPMPETGWIASLAVGAYLSFGKGSERGRLSHLSDAGIALPAFMRRIGDSVDSIVHDCFEQRCRSFYGDYKNTGKLPAGQQGAVRLLRSVDDPKRRWVDGTPLNTCYLWALAELFPDAAFIHNLRRPHEVVNSLEGFANAGGRQHDLAEGLQTWIHNTECASLAEQAFGRSKVFRLDFDRISAHPEQLLRDLSEFLEEDYCADCLLPFGERINSSGVEDRLESTLQRLTGMPVYQSADRMFKTLTSHPVREEGDFRAELALRRKFLIACEERSLV